MSWRGRLAAATLAATLGLSAPAAARTVLGSAPETDAVAVTGDALVYAFDGEYDAFGVFERGANGKPRRLRQFDDLRSLRAPRRDADANERAVEVAASPSLVAVAVSRVSVFYEGAGEFSEPGESAVAIARPGGRARRLVQCRRFSAGGVVVDGSVVAYLGAACRGWIGVYDAAGGRRRVVRPPPGGSFSELDVSGRYLAAAEQTRAGDEQIGVYDWQTGRRIYGMAAGTGFALGPGGTLAITRGAGGNDCDVTEVAWRTPKRRSPRILAGACDEGVLLEGDRLVWSRRTANAAGSEYVVTTLSSGRTQTLFNARIGTGNQRFPVYFDRTRVGYSTLGCDGRERIVVDSVADLVHGAPLDPGSCTISLARVPRTVRVNRRGEFRIELASRTGCEGSLSLFDPAEQREVALYSGKLNVGVPERGRREAIPTLADPEKNRLASAGRLDVELRVLVFQPDGTTLTRSAPLTLLPPA